MIWIKQRTQLAASIANSMLIQPPQTARCSRAPSRTAVVSVIVCQRATTGRLAVPTCWDWLQRMLTITLDVDWLYRRLGVVVLRQFDRWVQAFWNGFAGAAARSARIVVEWTYRHHGADGILARTWPTGLMAFWTTVVLAAYLVLSYL